MPPPQQQSQGGDNSLAAMWIMVLLFIVLLLIWHFFKQQIIATVIHVKLVEISFLNIFTSKLTSLGVRLQHPPMTEDLDFDYLVKVSAIVGDYLRYPVAAVLGIGGVYLCFGSADLRFRSTYDMKKLIHTEKKNWPQITPVSKLNLLKEPLDKGAWAMSPTPMQFAKKYELLKIENKALAAGMLSRQARPTAKVIKGKAQQIFSLQVGKPWQGIDKLNPHTRALFAVFIAKGQGDDRGARQLLSQISRSTTDGNLDFAGADGLIKKYSKAKPVQDIIKRHAYVLGVMASLLEYARLDGVLATADFLWLKPIDRPLWYMLNSVGRKTVVAETAGAFAHWLTEVELQKALRVPHVDEASKALDTAINEVIYIPDEEK